MYRPWQTRRMADYSYATVLAGLQRKIEKDYARLFAIASEGDPQRAGHGGEYTWVKLLKKWLPSSYKVGTRKYIIPEDGTSPHEWDIVVFRPNCPPQMRKSEAVLAGGVAAAFSVKTTLTGKLIKEELPKAIELKRSMLRRSGSLRDEILPLFPCGILAHSHSWTKSNTKANHPTPSDRVTTTLVELEDGLVRHPRELIDFICVADVAAWMTTRVTHVPEVAMPADWPFRPYLSKDYPWVAVTTLLSTAKMPYPDEAVLGFNFGPNVALESPVGAFITALLVRLSYSDPALSPIAESLQVNGTLGLMHGKPRGWSMPEVYTAEKLSGLPHLPMEVFH